jgi:hypothetical protein
LLRVQGKLRGCYIKARFSMYSQKGLFARCSEALFQYLEVTGAATLCS